MSHSLHRAEATHEAFARWILLVTAAEATGFVAPVLAGVLTADLGWQVSVPALLGAGTVEGALLGWAQAVVLRETLPSLPVRHWTALTAGAAMVAYAVGLAIAGVSSAPGGTRIAVAIVGSVVILTSLGSAQWLELRHHVTNAARWILVTAIAWTAALGAFLAVTTPLWHGGQRAVLTVLVGVGGGLVMAFVQATVTGAWLFGAGPPPRRFEQEGRLLLRRGDGPVGRHAAAGRS